MSIWCSQETIGFDEFRDPDDPQLGEVRSFATGWSNHYPDREVEQPSSIDLAHVPAWCVPGHGYDELGNEATRYDVIGPWLRLSVDGWKHNYFQPRQVEGREHIDVVLDEAAARALRYQLTVWLDTPKVHPHTVPPPP